MDKVQRENRKEGLRVGERASAQPVNGWGLASTVPRVTSRNTATALV